MIYFLLALTGLAAFGALVLKTISWKESMWARQKVKKLSAAEERQQKILAPKADFSVRKRLRRQASARQRSV
ncbi:hypothetical protein [Roseibium sp.]|uniref:hypothetical protein n=1 Tax=Roseibium sp. TaxID=1936156 RepID=UPI003D0F9811